MADSRRQENKFLPFALFVNLNLFNLITLFWDCKLKFNNITLTDILHALDLSWLSFSFYTSGKFFCLFLSKNHKTILSSATNGAEPWHVIITYLWTMIFWSDITLPVSQSRLRSLLMVALCIKLFPNSPIYNRWRIQFKPSGSYIYRKLPFIWNLFLYVASGLKGRLLS